jgi:hypothetical protein
LVPWSGEADRIGALNRAEMLARGELAPEGAPPLRRLKNLLSVLVLLAAVSGGAWLAGGTLAEVIGAGLIALGVVAGVWIVSKRRRAHDAADTPTLQ